MKIELFYYFKCIWKIFNLIQYDKHRGPICVGILQGRVLWFLKIDFAIISSQLETYINWVYKGELKLA